MIYGYGAITFEAEDSIPSIMWYKKFKEKFKHMIWLNPIQKHEWTDTYGCFTLNKIREIIHMEDLTLQGSNHCSQLKDKITYNNIFINIVWKID
jgi:uncharacterized protein with von Willebrand factor type A (vWA) domain